MFDRNPTVDDLLLRADLAMYVVKQRGGGDVLVHTPGLKCSHATGCAGTSCVWR